MFAPGFNQGLGIAAGFVDGALNALAGQVGRGGEAPGAIDQRSDPDTRYGRVIGHVDPAFLGHKGITSAFMIAKFDETLAAADDVFKQIFHMTILWEIRSIASLAEGRPF